MTCFAGSEALQRLGVDSCRVLQEHEEGWSRVGDRSGHCQQSLLVREGSRESLGSNASAAEQATEFYARRRLSSLERTAFKGRDGRRHKFWLGVIPTANTGRNGRPAHPQPLCWQRSTVRRARGEQQMSPAVRRSDWNRGRSEDELHQNTTRGLPLISRLPQISEAGVESRRCQLTFTRESARRDEMKHGVIFPRNCAVRERTGDGINVGRCWFHVSEDERGHLICPRHGDVTAIQAHYQVTGELSEDPRRFER